MRTKPLGRGFLGLLCLAIGSIPAFAGDSLYGTVTAVDLRAEVVRFDYGHGHGHGQYAIRLAGIDVPPQVANKARNFVATLVLDKKARIRFEYRTRSREMVARLFTAAPVIKDVGLELVRAGLARRQPNYDYKYGELSAAENEARRLSLGLWAPR